MAVMSVATHEIGAVSAHLNEVYPMLPFTPVRGHGVYLENARRASSICTAATRSLRSVMPIAT